MPEYIDPRTIDLSKTEHKLYCNGLFRKNIDDDKMHLQEMLSVWDGFENFLEDKEIPPGFSSDALKQLQKDPTALLKNDDGEYWYHIPEVRNIIERTIGELISGKKTTIVEEDHPRNSKIAKVIRRVLDDVERDKDVWIKTTKKCIEKSTQIGLAWSDIDWNPRKLPKGDFVYEFVSARDVLVDNQSREDFFEDSRRRTRMKKMSLHEARKFLKRFGVKPDAVVSDNEYDSYHNLKKEPLKEEGTVTLYFIQYRETFCDGVNYNEAEGQMSLAGEGQNLSNQAVSPTGEVIELDSEVEVYFKAIYNTALGTVYHNVNEIGQFTLTPYYNKHSDTQFYPHGDCYFLKRIGLMYDVLNTYFAEYVKKSLRTPVAVEEKTWMKYEEAINQAMATGDAFPVESIGGIKELSLMRDLPQGFIALIERTRGYLKDAGYMHEANEGKYADTNKQISGKALDIMNIQASKPLNYKEQHIEYAKTQELRIIYKIISLYFTQANFIKAQDTDSDKNDFIPINTTMTLPEYFQYLQERGAKPEEYEDEHDVHYIKPKMQALAPQDIGNIEQMMLIVINPLGDDADLKLRVTYDFDHERNKQARQQKAAYAFDKGLMDPLSFLKEMEFENASEMLKKVDDRNQMLQMGKEILEGGPELAQAVMTLVQKFKTIQKVRQQNKNNFNNINQPSMERQAA